MDSVPSWPKDRNGGARESVEPFLHSYFDIRLDDAWKWLVEHGQLKAFPDAAYNPMTDATQHIVAHRTNRCRECALWNMLAILWTVSAELDGIEGLQEALRVGDIALRSLLEFRGCIDALSETRTAANPTPVASALAASMTETARQLELFADTAQTALSPEARVALSNSRTLVTTICMSLHDAGFSYGQIAKLIGDRATGARARMRMRCTRGRENA